MKGTVLPDAPARTRIATDLDGTLFVEAAAGTGKTTQLVGRVLALVTTGRARMPEIAAITFTEKAAAELRDRVRQGLAELVGNPGTGNAERQRSHDALAEIDDAAVCTLHAFAQRILAEYPLEAGLPPGFEVVDEIEAASEFEAAWERFVATLLDEGAAGGEPVRTALLLGLEVHHLHELARALRNHWDRLVDRPVPTPSVPPVDLEPIVASLAAAVGRLDTCTDPSDRMATHLGGIAPVLDELRGLEGVEALAFLREAPKFSFTYGRAANWGGTDQLDDVKGRLADADGERDRLLAATCGGAIGALAERVRAFTLECAGERRRRGRIEFHDLLVLARQLLRERPDVRAAAGSRWRWLLIDEFQDTDPIQIEIAALLAALDEGDVEGRPWTEIPTEPGRLFFVGDPKQSIYRFRRADMAVYHAAWERHAHGQITLAANFRCSPAVIAWVNHAFGALMGGGDPGRQAAHVELEATRHHEGAVVRRIGDASDDPIATIREREAAEVAREIGEARATGWIVDGGAGGHPLRYDDVAVLLPTRRMLPELERALSGAGVPYRIESRSLVWATQEVRDLLSVLRAVAAPGDEVATVAALRSPAIACQDADLLDWRRRGGAWRTDVAPPDGVPDDHPVAAGVAYLRAVAADHHWSPLHVTVERVLRELRFAEVQTAHARPRDHWRRLRFVLDQARVFAERGGTTLLSFVEWAQSQADEEALVNDAILPEADDDAVRIMTIHAAKGLEFPAVVLAGLHTYPPPRRPPVLFRPDGGIELAAGRTDLRFETPGYAQSLADERVAEQHEGLRLLYVAATRARDHLVVSLHHKANERRSHAYRLARCPDLDNWWSPSPGVRSDMPEAPPPGPELALAWGSLGREVWNAERMHELERAFRVRATAATQLAEPSAPTGDDDAPDAPPWRRGRAGTSVGRAVHAVLQSIDLESGDGLESLARAQAVTEGVPERGDDVVRAVRAALESPLIRDAVAGGRYWREVYVGAPVAESLLEGYVDLLVEGDDGFQVIDYKTDRLDEDGGTLPERYRLQGAAYALAVGRAVGRDVTRCTFLFLGQGRAVEVDVDDLAAAMGEVQARLA